MWEDEANKFGGKWIVRLRKGGEFQIFSFFSYSLVLWISGLSSRCWENLVLAMLGEQFMVGEEICGAVVSIRFQEDILRWALGSVQLSCLLSSLSTGRHYDESTNTESLSPYHMNWIIVCSIWNRTACDQAVTNRIRDTFRRVWILHFLSLLADVQLIYIDSWDTFRRVWILHFFSLLADVDWYMLYIRTSKLHIFTCWSHNFLSQVLSLPTGTAIEYKAHNDSLKWALFLTLT